MTDLQNLIYQAHSGVRWLVVLATVVAIIAILIGLLQRRDFQTFARRWMTIFSSLVGLQWLLGVILIVALGVYTSTQWEHAATMTIALIVAHLYLAFRRRDDQTRYVASLAVIIVTVIIVFVGVARLPQGWMG
jgi:hypothetical protein